MTNQANVNAQKSHGAQVNINQQGEQVNINNINNITNLHIDKSQNANGEIEGPYILVKGVSVYNVPRNIFQFITGNSITIAVDTSISDVRVNLSDPKNIGALKEDICKVIKVSSDNNKVVVNGPFKKPEVEKKSGNVIINPSGNDTVEGRDKYELTEDDEMTTIIATHEINRKGGTDWKVMHSMQMSNGSIIIIPRNNDTIEGKPAYEDTPNSEIKLVKSHVNKFGGTDWRIDFGS